MYKLYRIELEDLSEYRSANFNYIYAENKADALIQFLDKLDLKVTIKGNAHEAHEADLLDAAVDEAEQRAPLSKLRRFL